MSQPEPLKCTGSLILQLRDVHLHQRKSYQTDTLGLVEKINKYTCCGALINSLFPQPETCVFKCLHFLLSRSCIPTMWQQWNMGAGFHQQNMGQLQRMCKVPLPLQPQPWRGEAPLACSVSTCFLTFCIPPEFLTDRTSAFLPLS